MKALAEHIRIVLIVLVYTKLVNIHFHTLIGYSSLEYPVISTGLQNTMDARAINHFHFRVLAK